MLPKLWILFVKDQPVAVSAAPFELAEYGPAGVVKNVEYAPAESGGASVSQPAQVPEISPTNSAVAAIDYALRQESEGISFLQLWMNGDFPEIRKHWVDAPEAVFIGADPLHPQTPPQPQAQTFSLLVAGPAHDFRQSYQQQGRATLKPAVSDGWKEAAIAWEVCASIHNQWAKGKDALFTTRQSDFVKHAENARAMLAAPQPPAQVPIGLWSAAYQTIDWVSSPINLKHGTKLYAAQQPPAQEQIKHEAPTEVMAIWDIFLNGKWWACMVSPLGWDARTVKNHIVEQGYSSNLNVIQRNAINAEANPVSALIKRNIELEAKLAEMQTTQPASEPVDERAEFEFEMNREEKWGRVSLAKWSDGTYKNERTALLWEVWQARSILRTAPAEPVDDREAFEREYSAEHGLSPQNSILEFVDGEYVYPHVDAAWELWRIDRAALRKGSK